MPVRRLYELRSARVDRLIEENKSAEQKMAEMRQREIQEQILAK